MAYFRVDVSTQLTKAYLIEAGCPAEAEALARQSAIENSDAVNICKIVEDATSSVAVVRLPDDGDIYRSECKTSALKG